MVFYRKYRPQTISELDLESVRDKLTALLKTKEVPHAFLFTGTKGLGKTSSARILAKAINCKNRAKGSIEPCNACESCREITDGSHIDVLEIDAASNRGIDEIRELREKIKFRPSSLTKKVYIIDEVHMLTTEAFNALLKTLEEPPSHAVFILATTEYWKLPSTIVSRAFHVQFEKPTAAQIARSLERIVASEKLKVEAGVLEKIAGFADHAFRDAAKILEELALAAGGGEITSAIIEKHYKSDSLDAHVTTMLEALSKKDAKGALALVNTLSQEGCDFRVFIEKSVEELRKDLINISVSQAKSSRFDIASLEKILEALNQAYRELRTSVIPELPLELAIVKFCVIDTISDQKTVILSGSEGSKIQKSKDESALSPVVTNGTKQSPEIPTSSSKSQGDNTKVPLSTVPEVKHATIIADKPIVEVKELTSFSPDDAFLKNLIDRVKKDNFSVAGVLRSTKVVKLEGENVELTTPFKFHGEKLLDAKVHSMLQDRAGEILGRQIKLIISIKEGK